MKIFGFRLGKHARPPIEKWAETGRLSDLVTALGWMGAVGPDASDESEEELTLAIQICAELALIRIGQSKREDVAKAVAQAPRHLEEKGKLIIDEINTPNETIPPELLKSSFDDVLGLIRDVKNPIRSIQDAANRKFILERKARFYSVLSSQALANIM